MGCKPRRDHTCSAVPTCGDEVRLLAEVPTKVASMLSEGARRHMHSLGGIHQRQRQPGAPPSPLDPG